MEKFKIVTDSSSDLLSVDGVAFAYASLKIITAEKQYIDYAHLDEGICNPGLFTIEETLITYNPNGGTVPIESTYISEGERIGSLPTPIRKGYKFLGWFTEEEGGEQVTIENIPDDDMTL